MTKSFFELQVNDWVQVMTPDATRNHCLAAIDGEFAESHCRKIFNLRDLVGVGEGEYTTKCQRCDKKVKNLMSS